VVTQGEDATKENLFSLSRHEYDSVTEEIRKIVILLMIQNAFEKEGRTFQR
jgi:hypothetical protein